MKGEGGEELQANVFLECSRRTLCKRLGMGWRMKTSKAHKARETKISESLVLNTVYVFDRRE